MAPATGAARVGVPVKVAWRSGASRVVGTIDFAPPAVPTPALATDDAGGTVVAAAATASYPAAFAANGGSLTSVRTQPWSFGRTQLWSVRCAFFTPERRLVVAYDSARVVSSVVATCEAPASAAVGSGGSVALVSGRSAGAGGWDVEAAVVSAISESAKASSVGWIATPEVFDVFPRVASVAGGRAITARGRSFGVAERVGVWVGTIGPLRARSIDDDDEAGARGRGRQTGVTLGIFRTRRVRRGDRQAGFHRRDGRDALRYRTRDAVCGTRRLTAARRSWASRRRQSRPPRVAKSRRRSSPEFTTRRRARRSPVTCGPARGTTRVADPADPARRLRHRGQSSFTTWRVPAVAGAGWFEVFVNLGSGDRASARILAFPRRGRRRPGSRPG